ncbi:MAG: hypothetical protein Q8K40_01070, partial [Ignavibacteria bacterium]|nr:hypothetical protein [Ignavibacteria bacterium]
TGRATANIRARSILSFVLFAEGSLCVLWRFLANIIQDRRGQQGSDQRLEHLIIPVPFAIIIMYTNVFLQCNIEDGIRAALNSIK